MLQKGGLPPKKVTTQKKIEVGDLYKLFDPKMTGEANWLSLKIFTEHNVYYYPPETQKSAVKCGICRKELKVDKKELDCHHLYHDECLQQLKSVGVGCVMCHL